MTVRNMIAGLATMLVVAVTSASAEQYVIKLKTPLDSGTAALRNNLKIIEVERFNSEDVSFVVLEAENEGYLEAFLLALNVTPISISEVDFINSPVVGGGDASPVVAADGHQTFVIERPIKGVGSFPIEKKQGISRASNAAIEQMGSRVEWARSYLTDIGTFCIYRATDEGQIAAHAELAGAPLGPITTVDHVVAE